MLSALDKNGALPPPESLAQALERAGALRKEIERIDLQVINPARVAKLGPEGHAIWRKRALGAQRLFRRELALLEAWVAERAREGRAAVLLAEVRAAYATTLRAGLDLEPDEWAVKRKIDQFLDGPEEGA